MNSRYFFPHRNSKLLFCLVIFFLLNKVGVSAQTEENPKQIRNLISNAKNDTQKADLLFRMSAYYLTKTGESKADLDSASVLNFQGKQLSYQGKHKVGIAKSMLLDAKIDKEKGKREVSFSKTKEAIAYAEKNNLTEQKGDGYDEFSNYYDNSNLDEKIRLKEKALAFYKQSNSKKRQADVIKDLGELYGLTGNTDKSLSNLKESLKTYKSINYKQLQSVYNLLSEAEIQKSDYEEALKYGLLAEKTALAMNDNSLQLSSIYSNVGMVHYYLRQNNEAEEYWQKAIEIAKKFNDNGYVRTISANISTMLIRQRKFEEAIKFIKEYKAKYPIADQEFEMRENYILFSTYTIIKQFASAKIYYEKLKNHYGENAEKNNNSLSLLRSFSFYHYQTKQYADFYRTATLLDSFAKKAGNTLIQSENHLVWFKVDSTQGKYLDAIKHYQLYKNLSDTIFKGEKSKQISNLQVAFESEKKDKNIDFLTQQSKLQEVKIANDTFIKYVFIGSIVVLALFVALLYNRSRLKQKTNKKLEIKRQQIDEQNEQLKKLLTEKEWLLKEIHHRVKNNLQIVISLLNTQSAYLDNEDALMAIQNSQHRMHAMSLIHQKLYQSNNLASIDMSWYIYELVNYMKECFGTQKKINFILETEKVYLDVAQAVPLGLIINEAVNNTIKYAFPNGNKGNVLLSLKNIGENKYELIISDNGIGLSTNFNIEETDSLGMNLMRGLSDQLDGSFDLSNENGLTIQIMFIKNMEFEASAENPTTL